MRERPGIPEAVVNSEQTFESSVRHLQSDKRWRIKFMAREHGGGGRSSLFLPARSALWGGILNQTCVSVYKIFPKVHSGNLRQGEKNSSPHFVSFLPTSDLTFLIILQFSPS